MEERIGRSNYLFSVIKFILFLIIFCFVVELAKEFWKEIRGEQGFNSVIFYFSVLSLFLFYTFIADLDNFYKKVQRFFFRSSSVSFLVSAPLILLACGYFALPKLMNFSFSKDIFIFSGGFVVCAHLVYIARENRGYAFSTFINYLFIFGILCIINILFFMFYLQVAFKISIVPVFFAAIKNTAIVIKSLFSQLF